MRLPGAIPPGSVNKDMVMNLDFAPTFLDCAGVRAAGRHAGRVVSPASAGPDGRGAGPSPSITTTTNIPAVHMVKRHYGIRTGRYKLIHFYYDIDEWELYDLADDPHELNNVAADPAYAGIRSDLEVELARLQNRYGDSEELARKFVEIDLGT